MHQCFTVDCDKAHERALQISPDSPLRQTDDFHAIEYRYEVGQLLLAEHEPDMDKQRSLLDLLRNSRDADPGLRSAAGEMLARLGGGRRFELVLAGSSPGSGPGLGPGSGSGADMPGDSTADAGSSDAALVASLMKSKKPADYQVARSLIEPRVFSGKASVDDVRAMTTICKAQKDAACLKNLKTLKLR